MSALLRAVAEGAGELIGARRVVASRWAQGTDPTETYAAGPSDDPTGTGPGSADDRLGGSEHLAARFVARDGTELGIVELAGRPDGQPFTEQDEASLVQLATTAAGVIEHLELTVELERNVRKHQLVADVAVAFASGAGLADMLRRTAKAVVDHLDAPLCRLWLLNEDLEQLDLQASAGALSEVAGSEMRIPLGQGVVGQVAASGVRYQSEGFDELPDSWRADGRAMGFGALPMILEGRCIGVLAMSSCRPVSLNAMTTLEAVVETAAVGIQRVRNERATGELLAREQRARSELDHALRRVDLMHSIGRSVLRRLDVDEIVGMVTDAGVELTPAAFGAFFYNVDDDQGERYALHRLAGDDVAAFDALEPPRNTPLVAPTFAGERIVRADDVTREPEFGQLGPHHGFPAGHPPVRSYLAVPVRLSTTEVVGGMFFGHPEPGRFSESDEVIVSALADYAAIAIDNSHLLSKLEHELETRSRILEDRDRVARVLQASLLPPNLPEIPGLDLGAVYEGGLTTVGGDFYDVFPLADDDWFVVLGDVCGKGAMAAARTALARHSVRTGAVLQRQPARALEVLNRALLMDESADQRSRFVSAVAMRLRLGGAGGVVEVDASTGGHHPPLIRRADGTVEALDVRGTLLGVFDDIRIGEASTLLEPGDQLVLYTDGVIEARRTDGSVLGEEALVDMVATLGGGAAQPLAERIRDAASGFSDTSSTDDIAIVVVGNRA